MNKLENIANMLRWTLLFLLFAFVAGCGGGSAEPGNATGTQNSNSVTLAIARNANTSDKEMLSYSLAGRTGVISEPADAIVVTVPYGTNVKALVATFSFAGESVKVGTTAQVSGVTANDFTHPVVYTVTATDGSTISYIVMVYVASVSDDEINTYSLAGVSGTIDSGTETIAVTVPYGANVTALVATFTTTGASVKVGNNTQVSGVTANNFTAPVTYIVTAADGTMTYYTVTVTVAAQDAKVITSFAFSRYDSAQVLIDESARNILVTLPYGIDLPYGTDVQTLVATFTTTGASIKVGNETQVSGTTVNDFTSPVNYTVTAADGTSVNYTVTVVKADISWKAINSFSIPDVPAAVGEMQEGGVIAVTVPYGTKVTNLVAIFTTTGNIVQVGTTVQVSSATPNDFTSPVAYTITAGDGTTVTYTVMVSVAPA